MKKQKGFTMVELLVVIAIIGILASIALISYNRVQDKAKDKSVISEMTQLRTQAAVYYDDHGNSYVDETEGDLDVDPEVTRIQTSIEAHGGTAFALNAEADAWAAEVTLPSDDGEGTDDIYCVDSTGHSGTIAAGLSGATACSAGAAAE